MLRGLVLVVPDGHAVDRALRPGEDGCAEDRKLAPALARAEGKEVITGLDFKVFAPAQRGKVFITCFHSAGSRLIVAKLS